MDAETLVKPCCIHLPGNVECPMPALYVVTWTPHDPDIELGEVSRLVCYSHLPAAVDGAIAHSARGVGVRVSHYDRRSSF